MRSARWREHPARPSQPFWAANGREKNHGIVEVVVYVILVAPVTRLLDIVSIAIAGSAPIRHNSNSGGGSPQHDVGIDLTIAQIIAISDVNETIAVAIDQVERIMSLREDHLHLRATLLSIGTGSDQEGNRERDGDKESAGGKLGCGRHGITL